MTRSTPAALPRCSCSYRVRRAVLQRLLDGFGRPLALVPMTTDSAAAREPRERELVAAVHTLILAR